MDAIAELLWSPLLCVVYALLGSLVLIFTGAVAFRRTLPSFLSTWGSASRRRGDGEVDHRDAFISALAASVGVGNLAGVATALHLGGPGALFWVWVSALIGMSFRMTSTYLAIRHRPLDSESPARATPMAYLERFFPAWDGIVPKSVAVLLILGGLVNANLIQSNSVSHSLTMGFGVSPLVVALVLATSVALVVIGGLDSIVRFSVLVAPVMVALYLGAGVLVLALHPREAATSLAMVFRFAFEPYAFAGGGTGYLVSRAIQFGISRGVFSHGSGLGIAPFFQGANVDDPARGAFMAAMVPLVDTLVVCTVTGLVILSAGLWPVWTGAHLTVSAFENALGTAGKVLVFSCLAVFAFTTVVSWAHFGERCFLYLGGSNVLAFRAVFCGVSFWGPFFPVALIWSVGDLLVGLLLIAHLIPLTVIVMRRSRGILGDLDDAPARFVRETP